MYWGRGIKLECVGLQNLGYVERREEGNIDWYRNILRGKIEKYV